jgi:hypothetical protein
MWMKDRMEELILCIRKPKAEVLVGYSAYVIWTSMIARQLVIAYRVMKPYYAIIVCQLCNEKIHLDVHLNGQ